MIGKSLSHYQILEKIGSGAMGEVYLVEDTKLSRQVAIKVLPPEMAERPERRQRFEREAKAVAALNHPNIVTIHSVEEAGGVHFYTMEVVKGKTLSEIIPNKGIALNKFLEIAIPLSDAISAAHEHGITHRDLKPDNIMESDEGRLKVLDFGLAKLKREFVEEVISELPTQTATQEGRILGTVAYMSPEQAEGKKVDHRSDIFSLGIVLYEMATGQRPFGGDTTASILSSILKDQPASVTDVNPALPRDLGKIIRRCLGKDPEHRYQTAKDLRNELEELKQEVDSGDVEPGTSFFARAKTSRKWIIAAAVAGSVACVIIYALIRGVGEESFAAPVVASFSRLTTDPGQELHPSLSPDGKFVAYQKQVEGQWDIFLLRVGGHNSTNLTKDSPEDDIHPAFSPDGESIAFRSEREGGGIFVMGATGESVRRVLDFGYDPAWSPDGGKIAVATTDGTPGDRTGLSELWTVNLNSGAKTRLAEANEIQPQWSPHGRRIAYYDARALWTMPEDGGEGLRLTESAARDGDGLWSPDGKYIYFSSLRGGSSNLWRVPIDEETGTALGPPKPVTSGAGALREQISISREGTQIAYVERTRRLDLHELDFDEESETMDISTPLAEGRNAIWPDVSPDGRWVVFFEGADQGQEDIAVIRRDGSGYRKLTNDPFMDRHPRWSPDEQRIAFSSKRSDTWDIWTVNRDGGGLEQIASGKKNVLYPVWSPDGVFIAYLDTDTPTLLSLTSAHSPAPSLVMLPEEDAMFIAWSWSRDGTRLAGWRRIKSTGKDAGIVVYAFESESYESLTDFGRKPVWFSDGRRLLFSEDITGNIFVVDSSTKRIKELSSEESPHFEEATISPDDRYIYTSIRTVEADIWLLTLEEER